MCTYSLLVCGWLKHPCKIMSAIISHLNQFKLQLLVQNSISRAYAVLPSIEMERKKKEREKINFHNFLLQSCSRVFGGEKRKEAERKFQNFLHKTFSPFLG